MLKNELEALRKSVKVHNGRLHYEARCYEENKLYRVLSREQRALTRESHIVDGAPAIADIETQCSSAVNTMDKHCMSHVKTVETQCFTDELRERKLLSVMRESKVSVGTSTDDLDEWIEVQLSPDKELAVPEWNISENLLFRGEGDGRSRSVSPQSTPEKVTTTATNTTSNGSSQRKPRLVLDDEVSGDFFLPALPCLASSSLLSSLLLPQPLTPPTSSKRLSASLTTSEKLSPLSLYTPVPLNNNFVWRSIRLEYYESNPWIQGRIDIQLETVMSN